MHKHTFQGQTLRHDHPGGEQPHGYFEHPEDGSRADLTSVTPLANALADADAAIASGFAQDGTVKRHQVQALMRLREAVRQHIAGPAPQ